MKVSTKLSILISLMILLVFANAFTFFMHPVYQSYMVQLVNAVSRIGIIVVAFIAGYHVEKYIDKKGQEND